MSIDSIRFRTEGPFVVLQVLITDPRDGSYYGSYHSCGTWRDATMEDMLDVAECLRQQYREHPAPQPMEWTP